MSESCGLKPKKVAIVGYTSHSKLAPFNSPDFEIWGLNDLYDYIPRFSRWFEIHPRKTVDRWQSSRTNRNHLEALKQLPCPIYMQQHYEDIPNSIPYPIKEVQEDIGANFLNEFNGYLTNSISMMIALAIMERFQEIHVYGVDMAVGHEEYGKQRPSCEFWLGVAAGRGIKLYIPKEADLLTSLFIYGYEKEKQDAFMAKINQVLNDIDAKKNDAYRQELIQRDYKNQYIGAHEGIKEVMTRWIMTQGGV